MGGGGGGRYASQKTDLIEGVERRATKLVPGLKELVYSEKLKSMDLPSMKSRKEGWGGGGGDMIETYKYIHGLYSVNNSLLKIGAETVTRGRKYKQKKKKKKLRCCTSPRKKKKKKKPSESWTAGTRCHLMLPTPHSCRLLRAGWMRFGKTRSFFTEFAYPRSDLNVWKLR